MEGIFERIGIDSGIVIIAILVAMLVLILTVLVLVARVRDISNKYTNFMRGEDGKSLEKSVERRFQEIGTVVRSQAAQSSRIQFAEAIQNRSLTRYGIVKYDAFDDVGGKLSFALAMLDRNDTGFVLNAIHSKENCYLYLKEVVKGESYIMLSHEEVEALRAAKKFGSEEEAILKYQMDRAVRSEKRSEKKLQEMKRPRRKPSSSNASVRSAAAGDSRIRNTAGSSDGGAAGRNSAAMAGTIGAAAGVAAAVYSANAANHTNSHVSKSDYAAPDYSAQSNQGVAGYDYSTLAAQNGALYTESGYENPAISSYGVETDKPPLDNIYPGRSSTDSYTHEMAEYNGGGATSHETTKPADLAFADTEDQPFEKMITVDTTLKNSTKAGNRRNGQPPKKARKNKNRKNNERKEQGYVGH